MIGRRMANIIKRFARHRSDGATGYLLQCFNHAREETSRPGVGSSVWSDVLCRNTHRSLEKVASSSLGYLQLVIELASGNFEVLWREKRVIV
jgi:hypothetical protein